EVPGARCVDTEPPASERGISPLPRACPRSYAVLGRTGRTTRGGGPMRARFMAMSVIVFLGCMLLPMAGAQAISPKLKLVPTVGPPTSAVKAKGSNYPAAHGEIITFDGVQVASALVNAAGTFTATFTVPASALPGNHIVTAADANGLGASATFLVRTDWSSARFDPEGSGLNPYENVINPGNAGQLSETIVYQFTGGLHSAPIYTGGTLIAGLGDGTVRALNPSTGQEMWSFPTSGPVLASPLAVFRKAGERCAIVAGSQDGH